MPGSGIYVLNACPAIFLWIFGSLEMMDQNGKEQTGGRVSGHLACSSELNKLINILTHNTNAKCFRNVTLINMLGLAVSEVMADFHPIRF